MNPLGNATRTEAFEHVRYELPLPQVARIAMAREEVRNAQGLQMTYELNECFNLAAHDEAVKVIILSGDGPHFSSGHDLTGDGSRPLHAYPTVGTWATHEGAQVEARYSREREIYLDMCERWRSIPKPVIAQVQGDCIGGGLMLAWVCDLIIASHDARFRDHGLDVGLPGSEFFMHPWEIGARKAKEWLFTSDYLSADQAAQLGMVNRVIQRPELERETLQLAVLISKKSSFALKAAKEAINQSQDAMGRRVAMMHAFALHQLCHANNQNQFGTTIDPSGLSPKVKRRLEARDAVGAPSGVTSA